MPMTPDGIQQHLEQEIIRVRDYMEDRNLTQQERDDLEERLYTLMAELDLRQKGQIN